MQPHSNMQGSTLTAMRSTVSTGEIVETAMVSFLAVLLLLVNISSAAVLLVREPPSLCRLGKSKGCRDLTHAAGCLSVNLAACIWFGVCRKNKIPDNMPFIFWQFAAAYYCIAIEVKSPMPLSLNRYSWNRHKKVGNSNDNRLLPSSIYLLPA